MLPLNRAWDYFSFADVRWGAFARVSKQLRDGSLFEGGGGALGWTDHL